MSRSVEDSAVVITGASSGIGRATAQAFAREGATLVLAARREEALAEAVHECEAAGGKAEAVRTDVTDQGEVEALARRAIESCGRIDTWVNCAAVSLFARFEEAPPEVYRRVIDTNFFGVIHGARAVLPYFREQGEGVLINVSSIVSSAPQPYTSAYVASKYAIRGFSESLRMELSLDDVGIEVVHLMPASIDTPLFQNAANYTGRRVKALDPVISPHRVADAIVRAARKPKAEIAVGASGRMMAAHRSTSRWSYERTASRMVDREHFQDWPAARSRGNLFEPQPGSASVEGGWSDGNSEGGGSGRAIAATAAVALIPLLIWGWKRHRNRSLF
ncbi:MAG: SDR family NAD(P)-dependent oxidoreductase [Gemmatimonadales bacterium]|nr:MAG: SDR family NAD(P)-dependent oxidoreductase [Gemmatimonadales bacterium]